MSALRSVVMSSGLLCHLMVAAAAPTAAPPVAGLKPDRRPEGAAVIQPAAVDAATRNTRLTGISEPWPGNVERIAEQGPWYSPMFRPGMPGPYDLRGWHAARPR